MKLTKAFIYDKILIRNHRRSIMILPNYKTTAGNKIDLPSISLGGGDTRFYVQSTNEEECRAYVRTLTSVGYRLYDKNEISAGNNYVKRTNLAFILVADDSCVFVFWDASLHTSFVVSTPKTALPSLEKPKARECPFDAVLHADLSPE